MISKTKEQLIIKPVPCQAPEIGRWLWAVQDARHRTLGNLEDLTQAELDWRPSPLESSIGSVLYHVALIEADWLYAEVLEEEYAADIAALLPHPDRNGQNRLTHVDGYTLEEHLHRLEFVRARLLDVYQKMALDDYQRLRSLPPYDVSPEWVLHHLLHHEAEHHGQIGSLIARMRTEPMTA